MAEYIEREKLLSEVKAEKPLNWTDSEAEIQADRDYEYFIAMLESQPKADVMEIKHGKWADKGNDDFDEFCYKCSICHYEVFSPEFAEGAKYKFCPDCGAIMDKE